MNKLVSISTLAFLIAFVSNCISLPGIPRIPVSDLDGSAAKVYEVPGCQLQLTVPAGWKGEMAGSTLHIIKDKIDIIVDFTSEKDITAIQGKVLEEMKELLDNKNLKSVAPRSRKSSGGVDIQVLPAYAGADSIDADAILCPSGKGAIILYSLSPLSTYKTDRPQVMAFTDTAKSLGTIAPAKK